MNPPDSRPHDETGPVAPDARPVEIPPPQRSTAGRARTSRLRRPATLLALIGLAVSIYAASATGFGCAPRPVRAEPPIGTRARGRHFIDEVRVGFGAAEAETPEALETLALEEYVRGVVAGELSIWSAPPAVVEAQAIAARSYALSALERRGPGAFLWADTRDQVFRPPASGSLPDAVLESFEAALTRSHGRVLVQEGRVLDARFHAACGGTTSALEPVFGDESDARIDAAPCPACRAQTRREALGTFQTNALYPSLEWELQLDRERLDVLARELDLGEHLERLTAGRRDRGGRWVTVELTGSSSSLELPIGEVRERLGTTTLPSGRVIALEPEDGSIGAAGLRLTGLGYGHGVGLCQRGARRLAETGWSAERLLNHYYPGSRVEVRTP